MGDNELKEIYALIEEVIYAPTKADAKRPISILEMKRSVVSQAYGGNASYKLAEAISSAKSAAGQVSDKEHYRQRAIMHWSTFKNIISRFNAN